MHQLPADDRVVTVEQVAANPVVLTFDVRNLAAVFTVEYFILMREYFHGLLMLEKVFEVILDKSANPLLAGSGL